MFRATGRTDHLHLARELADSERRRLSGLTYPHWWRLCERTSLLDGLLMLHAASAST